MKMDGDVHRLPNLDQVEREASEWIVRLEADDVSDEDRKRFEAWHGAHPLHVRVYEELSDTRRQLGAVGPLVREVYFAQSMNRAASMRPSRWRWIIAAAGTAVVIALIGAMFIERIASDTMFKTAIGEHATIGLPDGSTLDLNSNSRAQVDYSETSRLIHLQQGEAFFKVAQDVRWPFLVVGNGSWIRATGAAFNVNLRLSGAEVTASEGTVNVGLSGPLGGGAPSGDMLSKTPGSVLEIGQQAVLRPGDATTTRKLSQAELARVLAWREGTVHFEDQPINR